MTSNLRTVVTVVGLIIFGVAALISGWYGPHNYDFDEEHIGLAVDQSEYLSYGEMARLFPLFFLVLVLAAFSGGWREIGFIPSLRGKGVTWLLFILAYPTVITVSIFVGAVVNALSFTMLHLDSYLENVGYNLVWFLPASLAGEVIWRGYFTNQLVKLRLKSWHIYLIVTVVWWLWWVPTWNGTMIKNYHFAEFKISGITVVVATLFMFFCWSVFYTESFRLTRSIWPGVITYFFMSMCSMPEFVQDITSANIVFVVLVPAALLGVIGFTLSRYEEPAHQSEGSSQVVDVCDNGGIKKGSDGT
ncbi:MAG: hypothetical protein Q4A82_06260 [Corynebacterium sp.]|nr:hypothetical protein [Corynebacterium sp.]